MLLLILVIQNCLMGLDKQIIPGVTIRTPQILVEVM